MTERQPGRRWWLLVVLVIAAIVAGAGFIVTRARPAPAAPAPVELQSAPWRVGADVELTIRTTPPRPGQVVSLTLLAPGANQPQVAGRASGFFGLSGVQLPWLLPEDRATEAALAAASGAQYIGLDFDWRRIEPERGQYDWTETDEAVSLARRYGLRLVPMLLFTPRWASSADYAPLDFYRAPPTDYDDYRDFVYAVVSRYKPRGASPLTADGYGINDWVIWNEPNVRPPGEPPSPMDFWIGSLDEYLRLLRAGYEGAHAADPHSNVLNGALADAFWATGETDLTTALERFYDPNGDGDASDGGRPFFDTLNVHTYQLGAPEASWYRGRLDAVLQVMKRFGDEQKPVWITETGYGSASPAAGEETTSAPPSPFVDEETQADAVRLIYETCSAYPQVEHVFWWSLRDYYSEASATNNAMEAHYGLLHANFAPKPAYLAYAQLTGHVGQVLTLSAVTDANGVARTTVPASFIAQPGAYIVFASLDEKTLTAVATFPASTGAGK